MRLGCRGHFGARREAAFTTGGWGDKEETAKGIQDETPRGRGQGEKAAVKTSGGYGGGLGRRVPRSESRAASGNNDKGDNAGLAKKQKERQAVEEIGVKGGYTRKGFPQGKSQQKRIGEEKNHRANRRKGTDCQAHKGGGDVTRKGTMGQTRKKWPRGR